MQYKQIICGNPIKVSAHDTNHSDTPCWAVEKIPRFDSESPAVCKGNRPRRTEGPLRPCGERKPKSVRGLREVSVSRQTFGLVELNRNWYPADELQFCP